MVHIKRLELTHFKSFGGTSQVPLLPGFTVVSGPNGSGKSNILDALLFCLGLASSKGMRAERLPDLINHNHQTNRGTAEASVTVTFDLSDEPEFFAAEEETTGAGEQGSRGAEEQGSFADASEDAKTQENGEAETRSGGTEEQENSVTQNSELKTQNSLDSQSQKEWSVTRKLRVTKQGSYTSNYYMNGESCTLTELHEQLNRLRVYPEGYNVVLQGDVTSIISMNAKERREIIDELAGVAAFDRKISQAKETLESVKEREDSCRIVERELISQRDRLSQDRIKAEKYQKLRAELQEKEKWETVLVWQTLRQQEWQLREQIALGDRNSIQLTEQLESLNQKIREVSVELEELNAKVKALGEEELLALQAVLATQEAEKRQLQLRQTELTTSFQETEKRLRETRQEIQQHQQNLARISEEQVVVKNELFALVALRDAAQFSVNKSRENANAIASSSEAWVQQQTALNRQVESLLEIIDPQRTEQAQLRERFTNLERLVEEQTQLLESLVPQLESKQSREVDFENQLQESGEKVQQLAERLSYSEQELKLQQETQKRLSQEQREKQRQLDKLEAQQHAQQEAQGTYATKLILQSGMPGICGLVAQLGKAFPEYQLALETAAGARLGHLVVEDDGIASAGIELLKQKKAGRVTFLPLNKIHAQKVTPIVALRYANGFIDYAINLIECEPRYRDIFAYVFGSTIVFKSLNDARQYIGQYRMVTLDGELLESSGAMTGGSVSHSSGLHFGTGHSTESVEIVSLKNRLHDIELVLERCEQSIGKLTQDIKQLSQQLSEARQERREQELHFEQLKREINGLNEQQSQLRSQIAKNTLELSSAKSRLQTLETELPANEANLAQLRQSLAELEQSQIHSEWQQMQATIKVQEAELNQREQNLRNAEQKLKDLENQSQLLQSRIAEYERRIGEYETLRNQQQEQLTTVTNQDLEINTKIAETQTAMIQAEAKLGEEKKTRDARENKLRQLQKSQQQTEWELQKLQETQTARREELTNVETQRNAQETELPEPLPTVPENTNLEELQKEMRAIQKRLQAMEPVNMLALEEYDRTQARLDELTEKLTTLEAERTELLLRIENFTTLRFRAFKEAFDAVNENFQKIFAELSEGDGSLTLDNPEDPFAGGLNLVAHPKGKPVQRLASMSGGEKSLTALSFIFALQRYRPSPFYSFDEVDMFLDGANVERLARMIRQQADRAQFIVVSHKGPMIKAAERVIGVTQARGAYTQVLGIKLQTAAKPN